MGSREPWFITYDGGRVFQAPFAFADWYFNDPLPGTENATTVPWNVPPGNPDPDHPVSVFYGAIALDPAKPVRFVTMPTCTFLPSPTAERDRGEPRCHHRQ